MEKDITLLNNKVITQEEFDKSINKYKIYTDINLIMLSDNHTKSLLMLFQHLTNMNKMEVSHSFFSKQLNCDERTIRRKLNKLKEIGLINWESGAKNRKMNLYHLNQEKYDKLIATLNTLNMEDRRRFIDEYFGVKSKEKKVTNGKIEPSQSELPSLKKKIIDDDELFN